MNAITITLDVRPDVEHGREPFASIMDAVARLQDDGRLRLLVPFQPVPLYQVMRQRGFRHETRPLDDGSWEVTFIPDDRAGGTGGELSEIAFGNVCPGRRSLLEIDVRGLDPPEPVAVILEAVDCLPDNADLMALTDLWPADLPSRLEERGYTGRIEERPDGTFATRICRGESLGF